MISKKATATMEIMAAIITVVDLAEVVSGLVEEVEVDRFRPASREQDRVGLITRPVRTVVPVQMAARAMQ
jgi:hypothetical protein